MLLDEPLIGIEPDFRQPERCGEPLRMVQQTSAMAAPLKRRRDGDVLDQQMVAPAHGLDQPDQRGVDVEQIDHVLAHGAVVVGRHRHRLTADERHPLGIGGTGQRTDGGRIGRQRATDLQALRRPASP